MWIGLALAGLAFFLDTPFRTLGQAFRQNQWKPRIALLTIEANLLAAWAAARFAMGWDLPLHPPGLEVVVAVAGLLLSVAGVGLAVWGKLRLGRWFSATFGVKEGHELITDGPYAVTRHPIYTGLLLAIAGAALVWNSGLTLLLAVMMSAPFFLHTVYEEAMFEKHFGRAYFDYERRVPRLVPFARRANRHEA